MDGTQTEYAHPAAWYDAIYAAQGKDYREEALAVARLVQARNPGAASLFDVGCGTGKHLGAFADIYTRVAGVDTTPAYVEHCRARGLDVSAGDMRSLDVDDTFDVVCSLFSAVAHMRDSEELNMAITSMACALRPGGVLIAEPWFSPKQWEVGAHGVEIADGDGEILVRANHASRDGDCSVVRFAWTHVDASGITSSEETLRLMLFTPEEYRAAFEQAGLVEVTFDADGLNDGGRGLWIGIRK